MNFESYDISICQDCFIFLANGEGEGDLNALERAIEANWPTTEDEFHGPWNIVPGYGDEEEEFSWQECDCCGSPLGGSRYQATAMRRVYAPLEVMARAVDIG